MPFGIIHEKALERIEGFQVLIGKKDIDDGLAERKSI